MRRPVLAGWRRRGLHLPAGGPISGVHPSHGVPYAQTVRRYPSRAEWLEIGAVAPMTRGERLVYGFGYACAFVGFAAQLLGAFV
jgi:hypothetical protein